MDSKIRTSAIRMARDGNTVHCKELASSALGTFPTQSFHTRTVIHTHTPSWDSYLFAQVMPKRQEASPRQVLPFEVAPRTSNFSTPPPTSPTGLTVVRSIKYILCPDPVLKMEYQISAKICQLSSLHSCYPLIKPQEPHNYVYHQTNSAGRIQLDQSILLRTKLDMQWQ